LVQRISQDFDALPIEIAFGLKVKTKERELSLFAQLRAPIARNITVGS
jgi:hypothetical protein